MSLLPPREQLLHMINDVFSRHRLDLNLKDRWTRDTLDIIEASTKKSEESLEPRKKFIANRDNGIGPVDKQTWNIHQTKERPTVLNTPDDQMNHTNSSSLIELKTEPSLDIRIGSMEEIVEKTENVHSMEATTYPNDPKTTREDSISSTGPEPTKFSLKTMSDRSDISGRQITTLSGRSSNFYVGFASFCSTDERDVLVKIWPSFTYEKKFFFDIRVRPGITVEQLIGSALFRYIELGKDPPPIHNIEMYSLRMVDEDLDGNVAIDEDFPTIERSILVQRLGLKQYALCEEFGARERDRSMFTQTVLLKVHVGASADVRQTSTIEVPLDWTFGETVKYFCEKKRLPHESYAVFLMDNMKTEIPLQKTLRQWTVQEIVIRSKREHSGGDVFYRGHSRQSNIDQNPPEDPSSTKVHLFSNRSKFC